MNVFYYATKPMRKKCRTCKYRASRMDDHNCNYIFITRKMRGCPVENCTKYEMGRRLKTKIPWW